MRLTELKNWLKYCNCPHSAINQLFYNAKLQGPAPFPDNSKNIPFVTTYYENIDTLPQIKIDVLDIKFKNCNGEIAKQCFHCRKIKGRPVKL